MLAGVAACTFLPLIECSTTGETFLTTPLQTIQEVFGNERNEGIPHEADWIIQPEKTEHTKNIYSVMLGSIYILGAVLTFLGLVISLLECLG